MSINNPRNVVQAFDEEINLASSHSHSAADIGILQ
jgi:hypothetical protein